MTVYTLSAQLGRPDPDTGAEPRPVPWQQMLWVTWRQHRGLLISVGVMSVDRKSKTSSQLIGSQAPMAVPQPQDSGSAGGRALNAAGTARKMPAPALKPSSASAASTTAAEVQLDRSAGK